ncbi:MAG: hypothetical protein ACLQHF_13920 [Terracidiphilus sp.]
MCRLYRAAALLTLGTATLSGSARAQAGGNGGPTTASAPAKPEAGATNKLTFDVASVRPGTPGTMTQSDFLYPGSEVAPPPGGLFSWNAPLAVLIDFAYDLRSPHA